jgi:NTP pyrophosphatase (non-canonical NTP hydrolase)
MSTLKQDKKLLTEFSTIILGKLRANRHKDHWRDLTNDQIIIRIEEELAELKEAIKIGKKANISLEAADVAVFCAMIAENNISPETK